MQSNMILAILITLLSENNISAPTLAAKYELSIRSVYRYIDILAQAGVPLYAVRGCKGGYCITDNFKLKNLYFTEPEYSRLINSVKSFKTIVDDKLSESVLNKLFALSELKDNNFILESNQLLIETPMSNLYKEKAKILEKAITQNLICAITYHSRKGEITVRDIEPHSFLFKDGLIYVYGFCHLRNEFRLFKLTRVFSISLNAETFIRRQFSLSSPLGVNNNLANVSASFIEIQIKLSPKIRPDIEEWLGIETVSLSNDQIFANVRLPLDNDLISHIISFGKELEVVSPIELREKIKAILTETLNIYN